GDLPREESLAPGWMAATVLWDDDAGHAIIARQVQLARDAGALEQLPIDLVELAMSDAWRGDFAAAASLFAESDSIAEATGVLIAPYAAMFVAALRGNRAELTRLIETTIAKAEAGGQGAAVTAAHRAVAVLHTGLAPSAAALPPPDQAPPHPTPPPPLVPL